jgi:small nuclear ribonucleoprotein D3
MRDVKFTDKSGQKANMPNAYIRGSQVMYIALPDMLRNSPSLQKLNMLAVQEEAAAVAASHQPKRQRT